ncbi:MAG: hypothetical protein LBQ35_01585, partial [Spirochaetaceae bacterium]|nr:hypothetical protein [Spirochaetaceae bacterium]
MGEALSARAAWLEEEEIPKLKEELRNFHNAFYSLYSLILKKKLLKEDPYKGEAKVADLKVPDASPFPDNERMEKLGLRLSEFDNQLDFLVNFYQFSLSSLGMEKVKRILGLIRYIDWVHLVSDASSTSNTNAMVETVAQAKTQSDQLSMTIIGDALSMLEKATGTILGYLKEVNDYNREAFKADLREVCDGMKAIEANPTNMKKRYASAHTGQPFYAELAEEVVKEDYGPDGEARRDKILQQFSKTPGNKVKQVKAPVSFKSFLIEGLFAIGSVSGMFTEVLPKL